MEGDLHQHVYAALLPCSVCNLQAPVVGLKPCVQLRACAPRGLPGGAGFRSNAACLPHSTPLPTRTPVSVNLSDPLLAAGSTSARVLAWECQPSPALLSMSILLRPCLLSTSSAGRVSSPAVGSVVCMSSTAIASGARSWKGTLGAWILRKGHQFQSLSACASNGTVRHTIQQDMLSRGCWGLQKQGRCRI